MHGLHDIESPFPENAISPLSANKRPVHRSQQQSRAERDTLFDSNCVRPNGENFHVRVNSARF